MWRYLLRRLLAAVPTIIGVVVLVFFAMRILPGDITDKMVADFGLSAADIKRLREQWGLDDPLHAQFVRFVSEMARGDLGRSIWSRRLVTEQVAEQIPATLELTLAATGIAIAIGVPLGILAAVRRHSWLDFSSMGVALLGVSMPSFWLGLLLILLFGVRLGWLPMAGTGGWRFLILPAFTLGFSASAVIARLTRSSMLEVLRQEYVKTAHSKGLPRRTVTWKHALRNAAIPVITIIGLQIAGLLGGAVLTETVFSRQGVGRTAAQAVLQKDFPLVQAIVLLVALTYVGVNLLIDVLYAFLDPRIRYD
jgi:peptide/nickel transport system permease protein/oligopeptide transport system permease protein